MHWRPNHPAKGPLNGLKVIDAGNMIAGPLAATQLADFGADVLKLELPGEGDSMRHWAPLKEGKSLWWKVIGRNKRLATLRLSTPQGADIFKQLVAEADVVIENYRPGTFAKWGLDYATLSALNPRLVLAHVSGFGQTGPYASRGGYGTIAEAYSGIPSFTGFPDKPPSLPGFPLADSVASTFTAMSIMMALYERDHVSGTGQEIDVSLYEPLFRLAESQVIGFDQLGIVKERVGNRLAEDAPRNTYRSSDGRWLAISASSQKTFERLAEAMAMPELVTDLKYSTNAKRCEHADELDTAIAAWFATRHSAEILDKLAAADVVVGPVLDIRDIFSDEHYAARRNIVAVPDEDFGAVRMQGVVPHFARTPGAVAHAGKGIGADNAEIFSEWLGFDAEQIEKMKRDNII